MKQDERKSLTKQRRFHPLFIKWIVDEVCAQLTPASRPSDAESNTCSSQWMRTQSWFSPG
jgi:hypothetical protein